MKLPFLPSQPPLASYSACILYSSRLLDESRTLHIAFKMWQLRTILAIGDGFLLWKNSCRFPTLEFLGDLCGSGMKFTGSSDIASRYTRLMKFKSLQENLRKTLLQRIGEGELTGLRLAEQTGFRQAHISNFLNRKRSLSLEGMDKVLNVQHLSVLDLLDPIEINKRASIPPPSEDEFDNIFVVDAAVAASQPLIMSMYVREIQKFKRSFLRKLRADLHGKRREWERFVAIKADGDAMSMHPRLLPGATVLIDRHYNSVQPYRRGELNMYAVHVNEACKVRYVEIAAENIVLRPHNQSYGVEIVPLAEGQTVADYLIGRVCYVGMEI